MGLRHTPAHHLGFLGFWSWDFQVGSALPTATAPLDICPDLDGGGFRSDKLHFRIHPADREWLELERPLSVGPSGWGIVEYRAIDDQGRVHWIMCRAIYDVDADGKLLKGRGMMFDVTTLDADGNSVRRAPAPLANPLQTLIDSTLLSYKAALQLEDDDLIALLRKVLGTAGRRLAREMVDDEPERRCPTGARQ